MLENKPGEEFVRGFTQYFTSPAPVHHQQALTDKTLDLVPGIVPVR